MSTQGDIGPKDELDVQVTHDGKIEQETQVTPWQSIANFFKGIFSK